MGRINYKVGDVAMIPISNSDFVFGRILNDAAIAIYRFSCKVVPDVGQLVEKEILFDSGIFDTSIANGEWEIIGNIPFESADESWPSPKYIQDIIDPSKYRIYHKGEMRSSSEQEAVKFEKQVMRKPEELVLEVKKRLSN